MPKVKAKASAKGKNPVKIREGQPRIGNYMTSYNQDAMLAAIRAVKAGMSVKAAAEEFGVKRTTLGDRASGRTQLAPGRPTQLTHDEERILLERAILLGTWGFPLTFRDFRELVRSYLDRAGRTTVFMNNYPSKHFVYHFMKRHPELSFRVVNNIKRSRAKVSREEVMKFFGHFSKVAAGVPATHIWNYDETNFQDDPGRGKAMYKKGTKYAERVINSTKSSTSVMFCASAAGQLMPPYVVYKAGNMYKSWTEGGPKGTRYNTSASGWFDGCIFTDFFTSLALPILKKLPGKKILVGDNLSSHISDEVISLCQQHNIEFVCLPANSTDKLQPLDVGYFGPMKKAWRKILLDFKLKNPKEATIPKADFPRLMKALLDKEELDGKTKMPAAFQKCGLHPINPEEALVRIPHILDAATIAANVDASVLQQLEANRHGWGS